MNGALQKAALGSNMATKPGVATGSGTTAGGSASIGTAGKVTPKAKPEVDGLLVPKQKRKGGRLLAVWV